MFFFQDLKITIFENSELQNLILNSIVFKFTDNLHVN
jgi:hypothetical protein